MINESWGWESYCQEKIEPEQAEMTANFQGVEFDLINNKIDLSFLGINFLMRDADGTEGEFTYITKEEYMNGVDV